MAQGGRAAAGAVPAITQPATTSQCQREAIAPPSTSPMTSAMAAGGTSNGWACSRSPREGCSCSTSGTRPIASSTMPARRSATGRTTSSSATPPARSYHSAVWQQLSNAHWRGIIWRSHGAPCRRRIASALAASYILGGKSDEGPRLGLLFRCCAVRHLAGVGGSHDRLDRRAAQLGVRRLPLSRLDLHEPGSPRPDHPRGNHAQTITLPRRTTSPTRARPASANTFEPRRSGTRRAPQPSFRAPAAPG